MSVTTQVFTAADPAAVDRGELLGTARRVVVKVGSAILANEQGNLDVPWLETLANGMADLAERGVEIILVSSGAVAAGLDLIARRRPNLVRHRTLPDKQALAAIGQSRLVEAWRRAFARRGTEVAQVLLTRADLDDRERYMNARLTLERLLGWGVLPIINENDTTATEELRLGDNDELSAIVGRKMRADVLLMLTKAEGLMTGDPRQDPEARLVPVVERLHEQGIEALKSAPDAVGRGGIQGKLRAARLAAEGGLATVIAHGRRVGVIESVFDGDPAAGTLVLPRSGRRLNPVRNFLMTERSSGDQRIVINAGAVEALRQRGSSLLPVGIARVEGDFDAGEVVTVVDEAGAPVAKGIAQYSSEELAKVRGHRTPDLEGILGYIDTPEAIHRDFMILL